MDTPSDPGRIPQEATRPFRSAGQAAVIIAVGLVFLVGMLAFAVTAHSISEGILDGGVAIVGSAFFLLRCARAGVLVDGDTVRVVNPTRTVRVPSSDVVCVDWHNVASTRGSPSSVCATAERFGRGGYRPRTPGSARRTVQRSGSSSASAKSSDSVSPHGDRAGLDVGGDVWLA
jgi:hypothetical protein